MRLTVNRAAITNDLPQIIDVAGNAVGAASQFILPNDGRTVPQHSEGFSVSINDRTDDLS